jgi:hypothetical protein
MLWQLPKCVSANREGLTLGRTLWPEEAWQDGRFEEGGTLQSGRFKKKGKKHV